MTILLVLVAPAAGIADSSGISGRWATKGFGSIVNFAPCNPAKNDGTLCGQIMWLRKATDNDGRPRRDVNNPDAAKRDRPLVGTQILTGLQKSGSATWSGDLYNPDDGQTYSGVIRLKPSGGLELKGCALAIFCETQFWYRPGDILKQASEVKGGG